MFNNGNIAIIDVGSDKIFVKIGEISKDKIFHIKASAEMFYEGYMDGDWLQGDEISTVVSQCLNKALYNLNIKLSEIYVGVPGDFARVQVCSNKVSYGCNHKLSANDIQLIKDNTTPKNDGRFEIVDMQVINFILDNKEKTTEPIGKSCFTLGVNLSYNMCKKSFCDMFRTILADYSKKIKFIDIMLAECLLATDKRLRYSNSAVLCDIGYLTTDVACIMGDGLVELDTIPFGGGHVAYDLSYGLEIAFEEASYLKSKIDFNDNDGNISAETNQGTKQFEKSYVSMIAGARLEEIAENITKIIANYKFRYDNYLKIYLTGRGIGDMKGVRAYLAKALNRQCELINPVVGQDDRNRVYLSQASLMQCVCDKDKPQKTNFFSRFFG